MVVKSLKETVYLPNFKNKADGLALMGILPDATIKTAFFDPQYRGVLDALNYGNEGKGQGSLSAPPNGRRNHSDIYP